VLGTVEQFPTKASVLRECESLRKTINRNTVVPRTVAELVNHFQEREFGRIAFSTRTAYAVYLRNWIVPAWGELRLADVRTVAVENWLHSLSIAPGSKAKIRNIMSALFNHAIRYEWTDRNPIHLVRQSAKRQRIPEVLTAEEIGKLLAELDGPYRAMAYLAAVTGLRVSELLALKWEDVQFDLGEIHLTRAIVCQHVGALKTEASQKPIPMTKGLATVLMDWRAKCPYNQDMDYVFASQKKHGTQPLWPSSAMSKHIRPAAQRAGIHKHVRWHVFRHSLATLLKENGEDVKTVQECLRHADSKMTLDTYTQGLMPVKRAAQSKVIEAIGPLGTHVVDMSAASA